MNLILENVYIDKLDDIINKYNNKNNYIYIIQLFLIIIYIL